MEAIEIEQNRIGEAVGSQDQVAASFGGFNKIEFLQDGRVIVNPLPLAKGKIEELEHSICLFFTGISRTASQIAEKQIQATEKKISELDKMKQMVDEACNILCSSNFSAKDFGELLNESWYLKRSITDAISNDFIDEIYQRGLKSGAIGGKLLGAGGGGFLAFIVRTIAKSNSLIVYLIYFMYHSTLTKWDRISSTIPSELFLESKD